MYKNERNEVVLTLGKKVFDLKDQERTFYDEANHEWVRTCAFIIVNFS